jgi:tol-pal system protein YbgF
MRNTPPRRRLAGPLLLGTVLCSAALAWSPADAQNQGPVQAYQPAVPPADPSEIINNKGIEKRLQRDEQALRDLRQIVLQAKAQGNPVEVKDAGPDPAVTDLQSKVDDFDQTLRRLNGEVEDLQHNLDVAHKAVADANAAIQDLTARVAKLEAAAQPPAPAPAPAAQGGAPGPEGVLGQLPAGEADQGAQPGGADEILAYRQARQVLDTGDYAGGAKALQDYLNRYPSSPRAPEANYWLGRTLALQGLNADAAAAYARSLKGWPQAAWAGDAVVRLSGALVALKRGDDACRALAEFDQRYAAKAATAVKTRARTARADAGCS